jgi:hypothetical protein
MKRPHLSRRALLRGAGAALALPWLEAMTPRTRGGFATPPTRLAYIYVPNGVDASGWTPSVVGSGFELPEILEPLAPYRDDLLVLSGLALDPARDHGDGGGDHARAMASFLTGVHPRKTGGADLRAGISADQVAAAAIGQATRFPSLEIGCEAGGDAGRCDHGYSCAYQVNLSWRGHATPATKEVDPALVFDRLFGQRQGGDATRRNRRDRSLLDFVASDARQLRGQLGTADQRKLDEYLTSVREVERRVGQAAPEVAMHDRTFKRPAGIPADYAEHLRLMADLLVLAFQTDLTRVATHVFANDGSNRPYRMIGIGDGHHDLSHHGGEASRLAKIRSINRFHVEQLAYLLGRLKATPEGDGSLLDHCMIVYGSGISEGNAHRHDNLPILVAGRGSGTLSPGRHVSYRAETPLANLHLALLERMGVPVPRLGDSTEPLPGLST